MSIVNVRYFSPSDMRIIYVKDGNWMLVDVDGQEKPNSEYYPHSQHWNGHCAFFPVDFDPTLDTLYDSDEIIHWLLFNSVRMFADEIRLEKSGCQILGFKDIAIATIKEIIDVYENGPLSKKIKEYNESSSNI